MPPWDPRQGLPGAAKTVVDFFVLARASAFVTNCPGESTFVANVQLLRDAHGLPSYRGLSSQGSGVCTKLEAYPSHVHDWKGVDRTTYAVLGFVPMIVHFALITVLLGALYVLLRRACKVARHYILG